MTETKYIFDIPYTSSEMYLTKPIEDKGGFLRFDGEYIHFKLHSIMDVLDEDTDVWTKQVVYKESETHISHLTQVMLKDNIYKDVICWSCLISFTNAYDVELFFATYKEAKVIFDEATKWMKEYRSKQSK